MSETLASTVKSLSDNSIAASVKSDSSKASGRRALGESLPVNRSM